MNATLVPVVEHRNEIRMVGRLADDPRVFVLPSGDELVTARLIVERPRLPAGQARRRGVDTVACSVWAPMLRRRVRLWGPGDTVEVTGALRRRFWRSESGSGSRYEIEVETANRLRRHVPDDDERPRAPSAVGAAHQ